MNRKMFKNLTPEAAWEYFYGGEVQEFISDFYVEGITDIAAMARRFAQDVPFLEGHPVDQKAIEQIAELIAQFMRDYIEKIGGYDKLRIYTEEELDEMWDKNVRDFFRLCVENGYYTVQKENKEIFNKKL